ncbi:MAG TPA: TRAP transporter small permease subunit [Syntrophorhabdaceae bacterium]|nr:TRAP transporter small permease subunit [Syntrophorhabdaceae bacterium]HPP06042.1 TRAP transporter small permease subunit [Syntrophorhabdaceae bacterium]
MERYERYLRRLCEYLEWVGVFGILCMFFANLIDVIGAKFFKWPLPGALEVISFSQIVAITPAIALGLFLGIHLSVDFIVEKFPGLLKKSLAIFVSLLCLILVIIIFWEGIKYANSLRVSGEIGSVSKIPFFPFAYVFAISWIPVILYYLIELIKHFKGE